MPTVGPLGATPANSGVVPTVSPSCGITRMGSTTTPPSSRVAATENDTGAEGALYAPIASVTTWTVRVPTSSGACCGGMPAMNTPSAPELT
ncbi:hypothetical protein QEG98_02535 [Myxococcus sp. MxC21-1]|nr:hypothetical protein [Myxococcus sp. MxC21-1]WNZ62720.1 hypothetical protein QEG98_02535 [Myxococcus sp. MxC21-1]